jgi:hypothetical protein
MWQMDLPGMRFPTPPSTSIDNNSVTRAVFRLGFEFLKAFVDLAKLTASGFLEIVNGLAIIAQQQEGRADIRLPFPQQHAYALKAQKLVGELARFVAQHGTEVPGMTVQALQQDLKNTQQMLADGDLDGALEKITYALGSVATALWNLKNLPKEFRNAISGLKAVSTQAQAVVKQLPKLGQEVKAALKPGGTSFRLKGRKGVSGNLMPDAPPKTPEATVTVATRPVIPAPQTAKSKQLPSSQEPPELTKVLSPSGSPDLSAPLEPAGRSSAAVALPEGWRFKSSLGTSGGKIELLDPRGLSKGVAFVNPRGDNPSIARLTGITVASDKRSEGLGGKLLQQIEIELASLGFQSIETTPLLEVRGFYQKAGYHPDAESFAGTWSKPFVKSQTRLTPAPVLVPTLPEVKLAGGAYQRSSGQLVLRSSRLEVIMPPGYEFGELRNLKYDWTISGHGSLSPLAMKAAGGSPLTRVPPGTRVIVLTPPGASLSAGLGELLDNRHFFMQYGVDDPLQVAIRVPYRILGPGETLPNAVVTSPGTLKVPKRPDVITVSGSDGRPLSALLQPNMGTVVINICSTVEGTPPTRWSNLRFDANGVTNLNDKSRVNYGLPSAGDQTPPVGGVRSGASGASNDPSQAPRPRIPPDEPAVPVFLPDGLNIKRSGNDWTVVNTDAMRQLVRRNPRVFDGLHKLIDWINAAGPEQSLVGKTVTVSAAMNRGRPLEIQIVRRFEPGSQSEVLQIEITSPADQVRDTLVLKVEHAEITARDRIQMRDGTWSGHVDFTTTYPDVVRVQELLKQNPEVRSFMQRHQIEFARWNFALDAGDARPPLGRPKRHYAIMPLYQSVGRPTPGDKEVMKELSRLSDSVLARDPATNGIVMDLIGADNYLIVNEGGVRKLVLVDPFTRPVPLQPSTLPRRHLHAPEFPLLPAQLHAVDTFVVLFSRARLTPAETEALHRWIVKDVATGGSAAAFRLGPNRAGQLEVQTALPEADIVAGTRRRVRTP